MTTVIIFDLGLIKALTEDNRHDHKYDEFMQIHKQLKLKGIRFAYHYPENEIEKNLPKQYEVAMEFVKHENIPDTCSLHAESIVGGGFEFDRLSKLLNPRAPISSIFILYEKRKVKYAERFDDRLRMYRQNGTYPYTTVEIDHSRHISAFSKLWSENKSEKVQKKKKDLFLNHLRAINEGGFAKVCEALGQEGEAPAQLLIENQEKGYVIHHAGELYKPEWDEDIRERDRKARVGKEEEEAKKARDERVARENGEKFKRQFPSAPQKPVFHFPQKHPFLFSLLHFCKTHGRKILAVIFGLVMVVLAFTPAGPALMAALTLKAVMAPVFAWIGQIGLWGIALGLGLFFSGFVLAPPLWIVGMALKLTTSFFAMCLEHGKFELDTQAKPAIKKWIAPLKWVASFFYAITYAVVTLLEFTFLFLAELGDKIFRKLGGPLMRMLMLDKVPTMTAKTDPQTYHPSASRGSSLVTTVENTARKEVFQLWHEASTFAVNPGDTTVTLDQKFSLAG